MSSSRAVLRKYIRTRHLSWSAPAAEIVHVDFKFRLREKPGMLQLSRSCRTDFDRLLLWLVTGNAGVTGGGGDKFGQVPKGHVSWLN